MPRLLPVFLLLATGELPAAPGAAVSFAERLGVMTHFAHGWSLDAMTPLAATGVRHVRDEIYWDEVEIAPGRFEFPARFDAYMAELRVHGIRPLVPLTFASRHHDDGLTPHTEAGFRAYARYAVEVLRHYGDQIQAVEIWNEYNGGFAQGPATTNRAETYTAMLRHAYAAIKSERPDVTVLGGSTAGLPFPYLERLIAAGALEHLDAVSIHPYRADEPPETLEAPLRRLQELLARRRPGRPVPIWVTEIGWPARTPGEKSGPLLDEEKQAAYLVRALVLLLSLGVEKVYWYQLRDHGVDAGLGLLRTEPGYPPKPAYGAFTTLLARLRGVGAIVRESAPEGVYHFRFDPLEADAGHPSVRLLWATRPVSFPSGGATRLVRLDGSTATPHGGSLLLDEAPIYLEGVSDPEAFPRASPPRPVLARSTDDFSFHQGGSGWSYGTFVPSGPDGATGFIPATETRVTDWKNEWILPGGPWSISPDEQHPALHGGQPVAAVRRWTSLRGGAVEVTARFQVSRQGDGVRVRVLADGREIASERIGGDRHPVLELTLAPTLPAGGHLDFSVDPGPGASSDHDATRVAITLRPLSSHE
jgi:hypothetical protein